MASNKDKLHLILDIIKLNNFNRDDTLDLIKELTTIYQFESNSITEKVPEEIWEVIIIFINRKKEIQTYFPLRLVSKLWNNIIQNLKKVSILSPYILNNKFDKLFPKVQTLITNNKYDDENILFYTNLTKLKLIATKYYDGWYDISNLTNLTTLSIVNNVDSTDNDIKYLTKLTKLKLYNNTKIQGRCFSFLTNLKYLFLSNNITRSSLKYLTNLEYLKIPDYYKIDSDISHLTNLRTLERYAE
jgi:hypothetical protein